MTQNIDDTIYKETLMDIYKHPQNMGVLPGATVEVNEINPMCGDKLKIQLKIENGKVVDAKFAGDVCAVGVVSAELLTEEIKDKTLQEVKGFTKEDLLKLIGINLTTSRIKCATLSLEGVENAIKKYESNNAN